MAIKKRLYGSKRDYPKIDIYVGGVYAGSTTWSRTCTEAVSRFDFHNGSEPCDEPAALHGLTGKITARRNKSAVAVKERLEYLRGELRAECLSYAEVAELQGLREFIEPGDVELLEAAGVPEFSEEPAKIVQPKETVDLIITGHGQIIAKFPDQRRSRTYASKRTAIAAVDKWHGQRSILAHEQGVKDYTTVYGWRQ